MYCINMNWLLLVIFAALVFANSDEEKNSVADIENEGSEEDTIPEIEHTKEGVENDEETTTEEMEDLGSQDETIPEVGDTTEGEDNDAENTAAEMEAPGSQDETFSEVEDTKEEVEENDEEKAAAEIEDPGSQKKNIADDDNKKKVNGKWDRLSGVYGPCSKTCGGGYKYRQMLCNYPAPANGGQYCQGNGIVFTDCNKKPCQGKPVDGGWSKYGEFGGCNKHCGWGVRVKHRSCSKPRPAFGGRKCQGKSKISITCFVKPCPAKVNGGWSNYGPFKACSKSCGYGWRFRYRTCTNPTPAHGGRRCPGNTVDYAPCNTHRCHGGRKIDGGWSSWSAKKPCSKSCGWGMQWRSRTCTNPKPANGGRGCLGHSSYGSSCNLKRCQG